MLRRFSIPVVVPSLLLCSSHVPGALVSSCYSDLRRDFHSHFGSDKPQQQQQEQRRPKVVAVAEEVERGEVSDSLTPVHPHAATTRDVESRRVTTTVSSADMPPFHQQQDVADYQQTKPRATTSTDYIAEADSRRRHRKPTMEQLEFPSGIAERLDATSSSRIQALYQLHYSDTVVRDVLHDVADNSSDNSNNNKDGAVVLRLKDMSSEEYSRARKYLEDEAAGKVELPSSQRHETTVSRDDDDSTANRNINNSINYDELGTRFTLYLENTTTDNALHTLAARFSVPRRAFLTRTLYGKDQCSTQVAFASLKHVRPEQLLAINLMRFPGFCVRVSSLQENITRAAFLDQTQNTGSEVVTLLRRVQVDGGGRALRAAVSTLQETGAINYFGPAQQPLVTVFRHLQKARFRPAVLAWMEHSNMRSELAAFVRNPCIHTATAARRVTTNPTTNSMLRVFLDTQSFYRTIEHTPLLARSQIFKNARRVVWNRMASTRVREGVKDFKQRQLEKEQKKRSEVEQEADADVDEEEDDVNDDPGKFVSASLKPRVGDFVILNQRERAAKKKQHQQREHQQKHEQQQTEGGGGEVISLDDVTLLTSEEEAAKYSRFDIVLPVPSLGAIEHLKARFGDDSPVVDRFRKMLDRAGRIGLVEVPPAFADNPRTWYMLCGTWPRDTVLFRRLLLDTRKVLPAVEPADSVAPAAVTAEVFVTVDPTPAQSGGGSRGIHDSNRILLGDRLLLQKKRAVRSGLDSASLLQSPTPSSIADPDIRESLSLPSLSPFEQQQLRQQQKLAWAVQVRQRQDPNSNDNNDNSSGFGSELQPAVPIADTSRMTSVVSCALRLRCHPTLVPILLREQFSLHGVMCEPDALLQRAVHAQVRMSDTERAGVWAESFCEICFSIAHATSAECPLHQRRIAKRVAAMERRRMVKESAAAGANEKKQKQEEDAETASSSDTAENRHKKSTTDTNSSSKKSPLAVLVTRDPATKKWGIRVDASLQIAAGTEAAQPTLAAFVDKARIVRVGVSPVATVEQLKLALNACEGGSCELGLKALE